MFISGHLGWKDVFPNIKEFLVSFQGTSVIQIRECLSSAFSGSCTFCFFTHPTENRATKRIGTTSRLPFITLPFVAFFSTAWSFVTTLHQASPSEPFPQQFLLVSCLCHILVISKIFLIILFDMWFFKRYFYVNHFENLNWICYNIASDLYFDVLALKHVAFWPQSSLARDGTPTPCNGRSLNCWAARVVLQWSLILLLRLAEDWQMVGIF